MSEAYTSPELLTPEAAPPVAELVLPAEMETQPVEAADQAVAGQAQEAKAMVEAANVLGQEAQPVTSQSTEPIQTVSDLSFDQSLERAEKELSEEALEAMAQTLQQSY